LTDSDRSPRPDKPRSHVGLGRPCSNLRRMKGTFTP
jgi:hypothetical protein